MVLGTLISWRMGYAGQGEPMAGVGLHLPVPVLVAQHIASGFTAGLVRWLSEVAAVRVEMAKDGAPALAGHAYG